MPGKPWFGRKQQFGFGYGPKSPMGWLVLAALVAGVFLADRFAGPHSAAFFAAIAAAVIVPMAIIAFQRSW